MFRGEAGIFDCKESQVISNAEINAVLETLDDALKANPKPDELREVVLPVMQLCAQSTKMHCKVFFPDRFKFPFSPKIHDRMFEILDNVSFQKTLILAPRGCGKTSVVQLGYSSRNVLFQLANYIIPVSCSEMQALNQTESLKEELLINLMIKKLFGENLKGNTGQFSKHQWVTSTGVCIMPRGTGQQIRGLLYRNDRPDLLILDDIEDPERVKSEEYRLEVKKWLYQNAIPAVDLKVGNTSRVNAIGTVQHEDSVFVEIIEEFEKHMKEGRKPDWAVAQLSICDEDFKSNWPEAFPDEWVTEQLRLARERRMMDSFAREYMSLPVSGEGNFSKDCFLWYDEPLKKPVETVLLIDPAKTVKAESAETAIVVVGVDTEDQTLYVREVLHGRLHPDEVIDHAFNIATRWKARTIAFEVTGLNEFITYPIKNEMFRRGLSFNLVELKARGKKEDRIAALLPFYRQGLIKHARSGGVGDLEIQLMSYPRSRRWDIMDAFSYIVELLESGSRYFIPKSWNESPEQVESEYDELNELETAMPSMDEGWMIA